MASEDSDRLRSLQTVAVAAVVFTAIGLPLIMPILVCYIIFATKYWLFCVLYFAWSFIYHKDAHKTGKWRSEWLRSSSWMIYSQKYYPFKLVKLPWGELDKKRNYLFCCFPHGIFGAGSHFAIATTTPEFQKYFPHHESYLHAIGFIFKIPVLRELLLLSGIVQASKEALTYILGKEGGGNISGLVVGGAQETFLCNPGVHKIFCKKRKGFIKIALTTGSPLVPLYVFGENELFSQTESVGFFMQKVRDFARNAIGLCILNPKGREDLLGLVPRRRPLTAVVGEPIDVQKTENPTQEQIDHLHQLFQTKIVELFESQKKYYLEDHETAHLEIC